MSAAGRTKGEDGFALAAAVLLLVVVAAFLLDAALRSRAERAAAWNTSVEVRARAAARGGLAHALVWLRALQARTVSAGGGDPASFDAWNRIDALGPELGRVELPGGGRYTVAVRDPASLLPLNAATADELRRLFLAFGAGEETARGAALAVADRRERTGPYGAVEELRGEEWGAALPPEALAHLTVLGEGRVNLNTASAPVLGALPGMGDEAVRRVLSRREGGSAWRNLFELEGGLSPPAREELQRNFAALARRASFEPALVEVTVEGTVEHARVRTRLRTVGVRAGASVQVVSTVEE
ncbi:MAG TPA: type II secretion system protein GspK [Longimicrobiaceae bacterium]|nr:type II secretion system protein GspK [Longimicrobiaceae bacterium]